jgi:hypothetical protein
MFVIHTDHHDRQAGAEDTKSKSFRQSRSNVETISQIVSPKELFPSSDILLISTVDSADFARQNISPDEVVNYLFRFDKEKSIELIADGGWHFNNLMTAKDISLKLRTFAHTEYATKKFSNIKIIKKKISSLEDLFNKNLKYEKIIFENILPKYIIKNQIKYHKWFLR